MFNLYGIIIILTIFKAILGVKTPPVPLGCRGATQYIVFGFSLYRYYLDLGLRILAWRNIIVAPQ